MEHPNYLSRRILKGKRWRHHGRQAGLRHLRRENQIPVIISNSHSNYTFAKLNESNLNESELIHPCTHNNTSVNAPPRSLVTPDINREPLTNFRLWNPRSIRNKTTTLNDYVTEHDVDVVFLTETWLAPTDPVVIGEMVIRSSVYPVVLVTMVVLGSSF